ncbi:MAG TPA: hypothetical protein VK891_02855 [Euzebyales bacterium]|nr:hypothetical protein [Euzebyales bacterium]
MAALTLLAACVPDEPAVPVAWEHAIVRSDGRTIEAEVGMTPQGTGPCEITYDHRVDERADRVVVAFVPRPRPLWGRITLGGCTSEGVSQHLAVTLDAPLGRRKVYDGAQRAPRPLHRETDLVEVTVLPAGFPSPPRRDRLVRERAVEPLGDGGWEQYFEARRGTGWSLAVRQRPREQADVRGEPVGETTVHGIAATVRAEFAGSDHTIHWVEGGWAIEVSGMMQFTGAFGHGEELRRVAEGVRVPGGR